MNAQLSLYDALVSVNIPGDKARAVVAAVEHEMTSQWATKSDLEHLRVLSKQELAAAHDLLRQEMQAMRDSLRQEMHALHDSLRQEMHTIRDSLQHKLTIRLGLMMFAAMTLQTSVLALLLQR
jgi:hypothetical protein